MADCIMIPQLFAFAISLTGFIAFTMLYFSIKGFSITHIGIAAIAGVCLIGAVVNFPMVIVHDIGYVVYIISQALPCILVVP